jgi:DNA-binding response OmpR family regulator
VLQRNTLLLVEDEILVRLVVAQALRDSGFRVIEASTANEVQAIFAAGEVPGLAILDDSAPGEMSAYQLLDWIAGNFPNVRVIMATGSNRSTFNTDSRARAMVMSKPLSPALLINNVKQLLRVTA